jgi:5-methylcytosine-specific restriction endonuclease McrA
MIETLSEPKAKYLNLLKNPEWFIKRKQILDRDGNQCKNCGSKNNLVVHHRQYHITKGRNVFKLPWEYNNNELVTLCSVCHKAGHEKFKVPVFNV